MPAIMGQYSKTWKPLKTQMPRGATSNEQMFLDQRRLTTKECGFFFYCECTVDLIIESQVMIEMFCFFTIVDGL